MLEDKDVSRGEGEASVWAGLGWAEGAAPLHPGAQVQAELCGELPQSGGSGESSCQVAGGEGAVLGNRGAHFL